MKRLFIFLLLMVVLLTPTAMAALTNGVGDVVYPTAYWWTGAVPLGPNGDQGLAWMQEVEGIIEGATLENGNLLTFDNDGTVSNVTNGALIFAEADEDLKYAFSADAVAVTSSTGVVALTYGTIVPAANQMLFTPISAIVGTVEGTVYYDSDTDKLFLRNASTLVDLTAGASGVTDLDSAYNGGNTIDVDGDAVTMTTSNADNNVVLAIVQNEADNDNDAVTITMGSNAIGSGLLINSQVGGTDITGDNWSVDQTGLITADSIAVTTLFESAIVAAAAGNVALTIDAAGNGTIIVGGTSTGEVTVVPVLNLTGALVANGAVTLGDAAGDDITVTGTIVSDVTLDDGATDSPTWTLTDATNEECAIVKLDNGDTTVTIPADTDFEIKTGNLAVGDGSPGTAPMDGEDFYVQGQAEFDGAVTFDGSPTVNADAIFNDQILVTLAGNDEEITITGTATNMTAAAQLTMTMAAQDSVRHILRLIQTPDADADNEFILCEDNAGDDKFEIEEGGNTIWTLTDNASLTVNAAAANTSTAGIIDVDLATATTTAAVIDVKIVATITTGEIATGIRVDVDDDTADTGTLYAYSAGSSDSTPAGGSTLVTGYAVLTGVDVGVDMALDAGSIAMTIDAETAENTSTAGIIDIGARMSESGARVLAIDVESEADGAGEIVNGIYVEMDDDSDNADNELHGIHVAGDGTNGTGLQHGIVVDGANIDAGLFLQTGYLRVGEGATEDQSLGDDDSFMEGTLEVDGIIYADAGIVGDGVDSVAGFLQSITNDGEPHAVTAAESGTVLTNAGSDGADAWTLPSAVAGYEYIFVVMAAQSMQVTTAGGDSIIGSGVDVGAGDNYAANAIGETLHLIAVDATNWIIISETGTWTDSNP